MCSQFQKLRYRPLKTVDNGETVFLWVGGQVPQPEVKFGLKAAAVYLQHLKAKSIKRKLKGIVHDIL